MLPLFLDIDRVLRTHLSLIETYGGETWWIYACSGGRRLRWSLETNDERIARRKLRKFEYEQDTGNLDVPSTTPIDSFLQAFCEHLQTLRGRKSYKNDVSYLRTTFGPICPALEPGSTVNHRFTSTKPIAVKDQLAGRHVRVGTLEELTPATIEEFIARRIKRDGISAKTANRHREVLHVMFNYAIRHHGFRALDQRYPNPADAVARRREAEQPIRHLSLEEIDTQIRMLADHPMIRTMVAVYIYAGLRREEALWLSPSDVDLEQGMIHVRQKTIDELPPKSNQPRPEGVALGSSPKGGMHVGKAPLGPC